MHNQTTNNETKIWTIRSDSACVHTPLKSSAGGFELILQAFNKSFVKL